MPSFGTRSRARLATCHQLLVGVCEEVIQYYDFTVLCGHRGEQEQDEAFATGHSKLQFPASKHNHLDDREMPESLAVDIAPWHKTKPHIRWDNEREFTYLAGQIIMAANFFNVDIRWGGNWDRDQDLYDPNVPFDLVHFELLER